ncbi:MAG: hypothetical protein FJZ11_01640, partial [Candidatus Omnitrophica bacterium]|nr:hypothetical protein [Candidatus Omnitrophota bacterium]
DETFDLDEFIRTNEPNLVGISINSTTVYPYAIDIASKVRTALPRTLIVAGGIQVSIDPEHPLRNSAIDIVVRSEGELIMNDLVDAINTGRNLRDVRGISYKDDWGEIVHTPAAELPDMDKLPLVPPDDFDLSEYVDRQATFMPDGIINVMFSRGCPYSCRFCSYKQCLDIKLDICQRLEC